MPDRVDIAATVLSAFQGAGDVIRPFTLTRATPGAYNPATSTPAAPVAGSDSGLVLFAVKPPVNLEGLELRPTDELVYMAGMTGAPQLLDTVICDGVTRSVLFVSDIVKAGSLYFAVLR